MSLVRIPGKTEEIALIHTPIENNKSVSKNRFSVRVVNPCICFKLDVFLEIIIFINKIYHHFLVRNQELYSINNSSFILSNIVFLFT